MFQFDSEAGLVQDREDLIQVLTMRFGEIASGVIEEIYKINDLNTIERLILVAANAPSLKIFLEELEAGEGSFRMVGERFNPLDDEMEGGVDDGKKRQ
ncbi:hypothetical protein GWK91_00055 [Virgibacillus sp. MSP4-1]|uniref:hypothetical protein n=1 Tax=Virgibacillus sp. MSP4-1 TaxID=2700081 RepID=UPI0003A47876|nr:hypothetical protein [Virgibacillus sp. MSP4-1]QHS21447.1 hypothetical protein GWK91_00055 [Virgibacillus sp. MSP4-1]